MCACSSSSEVIVTYNPFNVEEHLDSSEFDLNWFSEISGLLNLQSRKEKIQKQKLKNKINKYPQLYFSLMGKSNKMDTKKKENVARLKIKKIKELKQEIKAMDKTSDIRVSPSKWALVKKKVTSVLNLFGKKTKKAAYIVNLPENIEAGVINENDSSKCERAETKVSSQEKQYASSSTLKSVDENTIIEKNRKTDVWNGALTFSESHDISTDQETGRTSEIIENLQYSAIKVIPDTQSNQSQQYPSIPQISQIKRSTSSKNKIRLMFDKEIYCNNVSKEYLSNVFQKIEKKYLYHHIRDDCSIPSSIYHAINRSDMKCYRVGVVRSRSRIKYRKYKADSSDNTPNTSRKGSTTQKSSKNKGSNHVCECPIFPTETPLISQDPPCMNKNQSGEGEKQKGKRKGKKDAKKEAKEKKKNEQKNKKGKKSKKNDSDNSSDESISEIKPQYDDNDSPTPRKKYAGEILCIHNPPCLLINGCFHFPKKTDIAIPSLCDTTSRNVQNVFNLACPMTNTCDQSCQYEIAKQEVHECQTSTHKMDKILQSACLHNPPCEMMASCLRPQIKLPSFESCPFGGKYTKPTRCYQFGSQMKVNKSINEGSSLDFDWKKKHLIQLTAKENVSTQVKPKIDRSENYCIHVPICKKLPECCILTKNYSQLKQVSMNKDANCLQVVLSTINSVDLIPTKESTREKITCEETQEEECNCEICHCESESTTEKESKSEQYTENEKSQEVVRVIVDYPKSSEPITSASNVLDDVCLSTGMQSSREHINGVLRERGDSLQMKSETLESAMETKASVVCPQKQYITLTARENVSVQANPSSNKTWLCRHQPPCVKIPKCLGTVVKNSFMLYEEIPDCNHRPFCELIPACCRKKVKETNSVALQFPATR